MLTTVDRQLEAGADLELQWGLLHEEIYCSVTTSSKLI